MNLPYRHLLFLALIMLGCSAKPNAATEIQTKQSFELLCAAWAKDCERLEISQSSSTRTYTDLPSYRSIVALGRPALPYLKEKMRENFMLAYAAAEIQGWKRSDFKVRSEQEFRDQVLEKMKE